MDPPAFGPPYRRQRRTGKRFVRILTFVRHAADPVRMANKDTIGSLAKGLRVIEAFSAEHPRMSISHASDATSLDRATARRCLLTLHQLGYADYDGKFFTLTARVLRLGMGALAAMPLAQMVQPWLDQLSDRIGQSTSVSILDETEIVYLARAAQRRVMSIGLMPGSRLPAHCTSMGRVLLAALPPGQASVIIESSDLTPRTPYSLTDPADIMARVDAARRDGYAVIDQEVELGLRSIAVPLLSVHGRVVAAINTGVAAVQANAGDLPGLYLEPLLKVQDGLRRVLR
jgi:IclR family pca regulon transcriptional regulator